MQFAEGAIPLLVRKSDLTPEITYDQAHQAVANAVNMFVSKLQGISYDIEHEKEFKNTTDSLLTPIVQA